jgi:protein gp37
MSINTKIEWTNSSWNPVTGCTKISLGCQNCYAERLSHRLKAMGNPNYKNDFDVTIHERSLFLPLTWKKPQYIFVNSMSDLFHEEVDLSFIHKVFDTMHRAHWHTFQILTKRTNRLLELAPRLNFSDNIWIGTSVENSDYLYRVDALRKINARIKFLSLEPLLGPIETINLQGIDWVIVGGESGPGARVMQENWVDPIYDACMKQNVAFFFKQWGGINKKRNGRLFRGKIWNEVPLVIAH